VYIESVNKGEGRIEIEISHPSFVRSKVGRARGPATNRHWTLAHRTVPVLYQSQVAYRTNSMQRTCCNLQYARHGLRAKHLRWVCQFRCRRKRKKASLFLLGGYCSSHTQDTAAIPQLFRYSFSCGIISVPFPSFPVVESHCILLVVNFVARAAENIPLCCTIAVRNIAPWFRNGPHKTNTIDLKSG
jgi:hypothetical protein